MQPTYRRPRKQSKFWNRRKHNVLFEIIPTDQTKTHSSHLLDPKDLVNLMFGWSFPNQERIQTLNNWKNRNRMKKKMSERNDENSKLKWNSKQSVHIVGESTVPLWSLILYFFLSKNYERMVKRIQIRYSLILRYAIRYESFIFESYPPISDVIIEWKHWKIMQWRSESETENERKLERIEFCFAINCVKFLH